MSVNIVEKGAQACLDYNELLWPQLHYDSSIIEKRYETFYPVSSINQSLQENTVVTFDLPRTVANVFYDLTDMYLTMYVQLEPVNPSEPIEDTENTGIAPNFTNTLMRSITYYWNNVCIQSVTENVLWSWFYYLLNVDKGAKEKYLVPMGFGAEEEGHYDYCHKDNKAWDNRRKFFGGYTQTGSSFKFQYEKGRVAKFKMKFQHFIKCSFVPESVNTKIMIELNNYKYGLMCDSSAKKRKLVIKQLQLTVMTKFIPVLMYKSIRSRWEKEPVYFHYNRYEIKKYICAPPANKFFFNYLTDGFTVSKVFLFYQSQKRYEGSQSLSPFKFERSFKGQTEKTPAILKRTTFVLNTQNRTDYIVDHDQDHDAYLNVCEMLNYFNERSIFDISYSEFMSQNYFVSLDLSVSKTQDNYLVPLTRKGNLGVEIEFTAPLNESVMCFVVTEISSALYANVSGAVENKNLA